MNEIILDAWIQQFFAIAQQRWPEIEYSDFVAASDAVFDNHSQTDWSLAELSVALEKELAAKYGCNGN